MAHSFTRTLSFVLLRVLKFNKNYKWLRIKPHLVRNVNHKIITFVSITILYLKGRRKKPTISNYTTKTFSKSVLETKVKSSYEAFHTLTYLLMLSFSSILRFLESRL